MSLIHIFQQSVASKQLDEQCSSYCSEIVKPSIQKTSSVRSKKQKLVELNNKILNLEATIKLQESELQLLKSHGKYCLTKDELLASNKALVEQIKDALTLNVSNGYKLNTDIRNKESESNKKSQEVARPDTIRELEKRLNDMEKEIKIKNDTENHLKMILETQDLKISNLKSLLYKLTEKDRNKGSCIGKETGIHSIEILVPNVFNVSCDSSLVDSGWTVIQRRQNGSVDFARDMEEYRSGFGKLDGEFFVGLDKLHILTNSRNHELYIYLKEFNGDVAFARYSHFVIGGAEENFKIKSLGSYSGNAGDSLSSSLNMGFYLYQGTRWWLSKYIER